MSTLPQLMSEIESEVVTPFELEVINNLEYGDPVDIKVEFYKNKYEVRYYRGKWLAPAISVSCSHKPKVKLLISKLQEFGATIRQLSVSGNTVQIVITKKGCYKK